MWLLLCFTSRLACACIEDPNVKFKYIEFYAVQNIKCEVGCHIPVSATRLMADEGGRIVFNTNKQPHWVIFAKFNFKWTSNCQEESGNDTTSVAHPIDYSKPQEYMWPKDPAWFIVVEWEAPDNGWCEPSTSKPIYHGAKNWQCRTISFIECKKKNNKVKICRGTWIFRISKHMNNETDSANIFAATYGYPQTVFEQPIEIK